MYSKHCILAILLFHSINCFSQSQYSSSAGFKGGYNRSIIDATDLNGGKSGYLGNELYLGLFSDYQINPKWNFENEIIFSFTDDIYFIEIPMHPKVWPIKNLNLFAGPKLDFILNNDNNCSGDCEEFQNFGISMEVGTQYTFFKRFFSEMRYSYGLVKQIKYYGLGFVDGKRQTIRIGLGMKF